MLFVWGGGAFSADASPAGRRFLFHPEKTEKSGGETSGLQMNALQAGTAEQSKQRKEKKTSSICEENRGEEIKPQTQVPDKTNCWTFSDTRHRVQIVTSKLSWQCRKTQRMDHQARRVVAALSDKLFLHQCNSEECSHKFLLFVVSGSSKSLTRVKLPFLFFWLLVLNSPRSQIWSKGASNTTEITALWLFHSWLHMIISMTAVWRFNRFN